MLEHIKQIDGLNNTLEMMDLQGTDDIKELEEELLAEYRTADKKEEKVENDQKSVSRTDLDDRLIRAELEELEERIQKLSAADKAFGSSGLTTSAVTFKDLTPEEMEQVRINALQISKFTSGLQTQLDRGHLGLITLSIIKDDLYQLYLETNGLDKLYVHRAATILLYPLFMDDRLVWYCNDDQDNNTVGLKLYWGYLLGALDSRNIAQVGHADLNSSSSTSSHSSISSHSSMSSQTVPKKATVAKKEKNVDFRPKNSTAVSVQVVQADIVPVQPLVVQEANVQINQNEPNVPPAVENQENEGADFIPWDVPAGN